MLECLVLGDSIAVGVSSQRPECHKAAKVGINSHVFSQQFITNIKPSKSVVISLGSNDGRSLFESELIKIRDAVKAEKVYWLASANNKQAAELVRKIAHKYGDMIVEVNSVQLTGDKVHPTGYGYKELANKTR